MTPAVTHRISPPPAPVTTEVVVSLSADGLIPVQFVYADVSGLEEHSRFVAWCAAVPRVGEKVRSASGPKVVRCVQHEPMRTPDEEWVMSVRVLLVDPPEGPAG